jgi:hypothetical protein
MTGRRRVCLNVRGKLQDVVENWRMQSYVICTYGRILLHWPNGKTYSFYGWNRQCVQTLVGNLKEEGYLKGIDEKIILELTFKKTRHGQKSSAELSVVKILALVVHKWNISIIHWWFWRWQWQTEAFEDIPVHLPLCPQQFLYSLAWELPPPICVGYMTDKVALWNVSNQVPRFSCVRIIPPMFHIILNAE